MIDPSPDQPDLVLSQRRILIALICRRHSLVFIFHEVGDREDHRTLLAFARNDGGIAAGSALDRGFAAVDPIFALGFFRAVALDARLLEDGFDVFIVSDPVFLRRGR